MIHNCIFYDLIFEEDQVASSRTRRSYSFEAKFFQGFVNNLRNPFVQK